MKKDPEAQDPKSPADKKDPEAQTEGSEDPEAKEPESSEGPQAQTEDPKAQCCRTRPPRPPEAPQVTTLLRKCMCIHKKKDLMAKLE